MLCQWECEKVLSKVALPTGDEGGGKGGAAARFAKNSRFPVKLSVRSWLNVSTPQ